MRQLAKDGARTFDWWPAQTERHMKKESYATAKDIILEFDDSAKIARLYKRVPLLRDCQGYTGIKQRTVEQRAVSRARSDTHFSLCVPVLCSVSDKEWVKSRPYGPPLMMQRPAVIAIMGHKDHGKTTLLDKLRGCVGNVGSTAGATGGSAAADSEQQYRNAA